MRKSQLYQHFHQPCEHETPTTTAHTSQRQKSPTKENRIELYQLEKGAPETEIQEVKKNTSKGCGCPKNLGGERNLGER
jgi:hypothetical protein